MDPNESAQAGGQPHVSPEMEAWRKETAIWTSDVDFWLDETEFFQSALLDVEADALDGTEEREIHHLRNLAKYFNDEVLLELKGKVYEHRQKLMLNGSHNRDALEKSHTSLDRTMNATESRMRDYKEKYFNLKKRFSSDNRAVEVKSILIPTDFSENAAKAVDYALSILGKGAERVILFHVMSDILDIEHRAGDLDEAKEKIQNEELAQEMNRIRSGFPSLMGRISSKICVGKLTERLSESVQKMDIDMVVMGTKGIGAGESSLFGSNTSRVIQEVDVPVMVVPNEAPLLPPTHILFSTDMQVTQPPVGLETLKGLKEKYTSKLSILHVEPEDDRLDSVHDRVTHENIMAGVGLGGYPIETVVSDEVEETISTYVSEHSVDLMVMITHHGGLFHRLFGKSVAMQMVLHTHTPILILHGE